MECSICGISDKMRNVSQALGSKGIVFACDRCIREEGFISLKKPRMVAEEEKHETMYERMARIAGVVPKEQPRTRPGMELNETRRSDVKLQEKSLREIVDRNYEKKLKQEAIVLTPRPDLVDNFHWIIMRVRRVKGLTQGQLAERINEPEAAIKMAEQGVVPEGYVLIDKLERFLKVRLIRERDLFLPMQKQQQYLNQQLNQQTQQSHQQPQPAKTLHFDKNILDSLTIADLKRMREEKKKNTQQKEETAEEEIEKKEEHEQSKPYDRLDYE